MRTPNIQLLDYLIEKEMDKFHFDSLEVLLQFFGTIGAPSKNTHIEMFRHLVKKYKVSPSLDTYFHSDKIHDENTVIFKENVYLSSKRTYFGHYLFHFGCSPIDDERIDFLCEWLKFNSKKCLHSISVYHYSFVSIFDYIFNEMKYVHPLLIETVIQSSMRITTVRTTLAILKYHPTKSVQESCERWDQIQKRWCAFFYFNF